MLVSRRQTQHFIVVVSITATRFGSVPQF